MKKFRRAIVTMPALALGAFVTGPSVHPAWTARSMAAERMLTKSCLFNTTERLQCIDVIRENS